MRQQRPSIRQGLRRYRRDLHGCGVRLGYQGLSGGIQRPVAQPVYQQPQAQPQRLDPLTQPLSVGGYMGMFLLMAIPFVNFIMMLIWLFGSNTNKNKKNFAIAMVLFTIIMIVVSFLLSGIIGAILFPLIQDMQYNVY